MSEPLTLGNLHPALRAAWHPVASAAELDAGPVGVTLMGERLVVARPGGAGTSAVAFADACPHRNGPLSLGRCVDGTLECPYHGWRFDAAGACVDIPALGAAGPVPGRAALVPHAVREAHAIVFVALEPPAVDVAPIPDLADPTLVAAWLPVVRAEVTAAQFIDNFCDLAHFPFVHAGTFGAAEDAVVHDLPVERDGLGFRLRYEHVIENHEDPLVATGEHPLLQPRTMTYAYTAPFTVTLRLELPVAGTVNTIATWLQPETATTSRIFTVLLRNDLVDSAAAESAVAYEMAVLDEDLALLRAMAVKDVPLDLPAQVHTAADRATVELRRILRAFVTGEV